MGNGFELSKFRTRFLFSDVEFGWDKMWILNWVGTIKFPYGVYYMAGGL